MTVAQAGQSNLGGLIRLGVSPTFGPYFMPYLLPILKREFPLLELYIREDRPNLLEEGLMSGALDCILTPDFASSDQWTAQVLCRESVSLAVPKTHPLAGVEVIPVDMLRGEKLLALGQGFASTTMFRHWHMPRVRTSGRTMKAQALMPCARWLRSAWGWHSFRPLTLRPSSERSRIFC